MRTFALAVVLAAAFAVAGTITFQYLNAPAVEAEAPPAEPALARGDVETIIREYLIANPEILEDVSIALQEKRAEEEDARRVAVIAENREALLGTDATFSKGNPQASITLVEFFDYNCPYCRRGHADVMDLLQADADLRIVYKEFPVLGPGSIEATRVALAAARQGKYIEMHDRLIGLRGPADLEIALDEARALELDMEQLERDMADPELMSAVEQAHELADALGITGTPSYVIGDEVIIGAVGFAELQERIATIRESGCETC